MATVYLQPSVAGAAESRNRSPSPATCVRSTLILRAAGVRVAHEFISRLHDVQAQVRPILQKQRDAHIGALIVVIRDNSENRRFALEAAAVLADLFPLGSRAVLQAIRRRHDPVRNGILFWRPRLARDG